MLVDKHVTPFKFNKLLKEKMKNLISHWCHVEPTNNTYSHGIDNLSETTVIKVQVFSENYGCL